MTFAQAAAAQGEHNSMEALHDDDHETPEFDAAADYVAGLASREDGTLPAASLLQLYGLYKQ